MLHALKLVILILAVALSALHSPKAIAASKLAFVVGIDRYDNLAPDRQLQKAVNDARAVDETLSALGFEVTRVEDAGRIEVVRQWQGFLNRLEPGDIAAFFFAGHGVELDGLNYLLPRDVPDVVPGEEEVLKAAALSFNGFIEQLRARRVQISLAIVDACRDNPFTDARGRSLGGTRGLARIEAPEGSFVMFSAAAGQTALDRLGADDPDPNSVFTRSLVRHLATPELSLPDIAQKVRREVRSLARSVGHNQRPAYYDELMGRFCPAGCEASPAVPKPPELGPDLGPPKIEPPSPDRRLVMYNGLDFYGDDLAELRQEDLVACASACIGRMGCRTFTFNADPTIRRGANCFLKSGMGRPDGNRYAISGLILNDQTTNPPSFDIGAIDPHSAIYRDRDLPGMDLSQTPFAAARNLESCRIACVTNNICQAFTFVKRLSQCWLKYGVPGAQQRTGMISGIKQFIRIRPTQVIPLD